MLLVKQHSPCPYYYLCTALNISFLHIKCTCRCRKTSMPGASPSFLFDFSSLRAQTCALSRTHKKYPWLANNMLFPSLPRQGIKFLTISGGNGIASALSLLHLQTQSKSDAAQFPLTLAAAPCERRCHKNTNYKPRSWRGMWC